MKPLALGLQAMGGTAAVVKSIGVQFVGAAAGVHFQAGMITSPQGSSGMTHVLPVKVMSATYDGMNENVWWPFSPVDVSQQTVGAFLQALGGYAATDDIWITLTGEVW